jgi:hypothetical protein
LPSRGREANTSHCVMERRRDDWVMKTSSQVTLACAASDESSLEF